MKKWNWLALLLCLVLPVGALAVTEGVVEDAPMVEVQTGVQAVSYLPDASYYAMDSFTPAWENAEEWVENERVGEGDSADYRDTVQSPRLTAGEAKRAQKLLKDYQDGKIAYTGETVLEKTEGVIVGVYALNAADFDGEAAFVILPGTCLTDVQLLSIIAAYDELGLTFAPDGLNYRNCARGGGIETNRFFADEERERFDYIADRIKRGQLTPPETLSGANGAVRNPRLQSEYFCGMEDFSIKPYRAMTDEELISLLVAMGVHDESGELAYNDVESRARTAFYEKLGCPVSMELEYIFSEGSHSSMVFTADGNIGYLDDFQPAYGASFAYTKPDGIKAYALAYFNKTTGELVSISTHDNNAGDDPELDIISDVVTQEKINEAVAGVEAKLNLSGMEWHTAWDNKTSTNWGVCVPVRAQVADNCLMTIYIGGNDGCEHGMELAWGTLVEELPEKDDDFNH